MPFNPFSKSGKKVSPTTEGEKKPPPPPTRPAAPNEPTDDGAFAAACHEILSHSGNNAPEELLKVFEEPPLSSDAGRIAHAINTARDPDGLGALHLAAKRGCYATLDVLTSQQGVDVDPVEHQGGGTCLHGAVEHANEMFRYGTEVDYKSDSYYEEEDAIPRRDVVWLLIDAGSDPRITNAGKRKPIDIVDPRNKELREFLKQAEQDVQEAEEESRIEEVKQNMTRNSDLVDEDEEDGPGRSGSESD